MTPAHSKNTDNTASAVAERNSQLAMTPKPEYVEKFGNSNHHDKSSDGPDTVPVNSARHFLIRVSKFNKSH